jgi:hypothetical protein
MAEGKEKVTLGEAANALEIALVAVNAKADGNEGLQSQIKELEASIAETLKDMRSGAAVQNGVRSMIETWSKQGNLSVEDQKLIENINLTVGHFVSALFTQEPTEKDIFKDAAGW